MRFSVINCLQLLFFFFFFFVVNNCVENSARSLKFILFTVIVFIDIHQCQCESMCAYVLVVNHILKLFIFLLQLLPLMQEQQTESSNAHDLINYEIKSSPLPFPQINKNTQRKRKKNKTGLVFIKQIRNKRKRKKQKQKNCKKQE